MVYTEIKQLIGHTPLFKPVNFINKNGLPDIICFDHDLGEEKSGYDCAKFVVKYCQEHNLDIPAFDIQSSNNVGKDNIRSLMNNWHRVFKETN